MCIKVRTMARHIYNLVHIMSWIVQSLYLSPHPLPARWLGSFHPLETLHTPPGEGKASPLLML
jgi:hypothetical protein